MGFGSFPKSSGWLRSDQWAVYFPRFVPSIATGHFQGAVGRKQLPPWTGSFGRPLGRDGPCHAGASFVGGGDGGVGCWCCCGVVIVRGWCRCWWWRCCLRCWCWGYDLGLGRRCHRHAATLVKAATPFSVSVARSGFVAGNGRYLQRQRLDFVEPAQEQARFLVQPSPLLLLTAIA